MAECADRCISRYLIIFVGNWPTFVLIVLAGRPTHVRLVGLLITAVPVRCFFFLHKSGLSSVFLTLQRVNLHKRRV